MTRHTTNQRIKRSVEMDWLQSRAEYADVFSNCAEKRYEIYHKFKLRPRKHISVRCRQF